MVYTCLFGFSEPFLDLAYELDEETDFVCFTDDEMLRSKFWTIIQAPKSLLDPHRRAKGFKHRPHLFFPGYEESLYIDNTVRLTQPPANIFAFLRRSGPAMMMFSHPDRHCVYDEAELVKSIRYDDPAIIDAQMSYYRQLGYPKDQGLHATSMLLRRHNDRSLIVAMNDWHDQVLRYSRRDQLSFDVIRYFHGIEVREFEGALTDNDLMEWPIAKTRLPRDFDDAEYLELHPDVAAAGVNPRKHYLNHGMAEGRPYRRPDPAPVSVSRTIHVDPGDGRGRELLRNNGKLNAPTFAMWSILLKEAPWTHVIDVGANYGEMLLDAPIPEGAKVIAFEPNQRIFPFLKRNLDEANIECDCRAAAVSDQNGTAELFVDPNWSGLSRLMNGAAPPTNSERIMVPTITLDSIVADSSPEELFALVKIDVEGHELSVLRGAERLAAKSKRFAALLEILHLDPGAIEFLLNRFSIEVFNLTSRSLVRVRKPSIEHFDALLKSGRFYRNDVVIRPKPLGRLA